MNVTKIELMVDQSLFGKVYFKGEIFYASSLYRKENRPRDISDIFDKDGDCLGSINGYYFDFGNKEVFRSAVTAQD